MRLSIKLFALLCMTAGVQYVIASRAAYEGWFLARIWVLVITQDTVLEESLVEEYRVHLASKHSRTASAELSEGCGTHADEVCAGLDVAPQVTTYDVEAAPSARGIGG